MLLPHYLQLMTADYGFHHGSMRVYEESQDSVPMDMWALGKHNLLRELKALRKGLRDDEFAKVSDAAGDANIFIRVRRCLTEGVVLGENL